MDRVSRIVEPPPALYASGPTQTGQTTILWFDDPFKLQAYCKAYGIGPGMMHKAGDGYAMACYVPGLDQVVVPTSKAWPSEAERQALYEHEMAHARGWRHNPDGRGTSLSSLPPPTVADLFDGVRTPP